MFHITPHKEENRKQLVGAQVAVLGAARSGVALARLLAKHGARVLLSDVRPLQELPLSPQELQSKGIQLEAGGHTAAVLESDLICISPGIPLNVPILQQAQQQGIPIAGEIEVAYWFHRGPLIAITGSNGKTTTVTLTGRILQRRFPDALVAGNIGDPFAGAVEHSRRDGITVLEVSSFQLETIHLFRPDVAVIMNLVANHLDRYPDFQSYAAAKLNILKNMREEDWLIFNRDDAYLREALQEVTPRVLQFSLEPHNQPGAYWQEERVIIQTPELETAIPLREYRLRGPHNRYNMMVAALLGTMYRVPESAIQEEIARFPGIEHRLEEVRELNGVLYVNDSKATTVDSLMFALHSFRQPIVLIAGGKDKGGDFRRVNELLRQQVRAVVLLGQAANRMAEAWQGIVPLHRAHSLQQAVEQASRLAHPGDVVLLSPACSSFDMFRDYEDRGRQFKEIVRRLPNGEKEKE